MLLIGGIVDEHIELAQGRDRSLDGRDAEPRILDVAGDEQRPPPFGPDGLLRLSRVGFLDRQIYDRHVGALAGEQYGHGAADPGIAARDKRRAPTELARTSILRRFVLRPRAKLGFDPGFRLVLGREGW